LFLRNILTPPDNENNLPAHYDTLATTLRSKYASDNSKTYYLSSAPQCPFPDASNPSALLLLCDFVFVQFYNNNGCQIGDSGFVNSVKHWSSSLSASALSPPPRLFVGAPSWSLAGPGAYANIGSPKGMQAVAQKVQALKLPNIGGLMFWDGPEGQLNVEAGQDIISWGKDGLHV
jgi:chitinase